MVQINFGRKEIGCKIVYYGPGMSGKTTNLEVVHKKVPEQNRGELTSISTDGDRTLYFDYMPLDLGSIAGMNTKFQLYTVPGQVYYNSTRKLVLQGVDGIVFVADSSPAKMKENLESLKNLEENLREYGKELKLLPHVIQFNKRDLPDALSFAEMSKQLNAHNVPVFEAVASTGQGVFPTLKALASLVLETVNKSGARNQAPVAVAPTSAPAVAVANSASAPPPAAPPASSAFTRNAPPVGSTWQAPPPAAKPPAPATPPKDLHHLMGDANKNRGIQTPMPPAPARPAPAPVQTNSHAAGASPASKIARSSGSHTPAKPISGVPKPAAAKNHRPPVAASSSKKNLILAVVFGLLVLAAAGGIVMVLIL